MFRSLLEAVKLRGGLWEHSPDLFGGEVPPPVSSGRAQLAPGKHESGSC